MENKQLYPSTQKIIDSPELKSGIKEVSSKFNLNIDQTGELYAEVRDILKGLNKSSDFVSHITDRLEIDNELANKIANDLNVKIFQSIKTGMKNDTAVENRSLSTPPISKIPNPTISTLEKAGEFTVEPETNIAEEKLSSANPLEGHDELIENIENPVPAKPTAPTIPAMKPYVGIPKTFEIPKPPAMRTMGSVTVPKPPAPKMTSGETHTDLLVDHLLSRPTVTVEQKIEQKKPLEIPKPPQQIPKKPNGPDMYREPIE